MRKIIAVLAVPLAAILLMPELGALWGGLAAVLVGTVVRVVLSPKEQRQPKPTASTASSAPPPPPDPPPAPQPRTSGWWTVLGVLRDAPLADVTAAYHRLVTEYHPDRVATLAPGFQRFANEKTQELTAAYAAAKTDPGRAERSAGTSEPETSQTAPATESPPFQSAPTSTYAGAATAAWIAAAAAAFGIVLIVILAAYSSPPQHPRPVSPWPSSPAMPAELPASAPSGHVGAVFVQRCPLTQEEREDALFHWCLVVAVHNPDLVTRRVRISVLLTPKDTTTPEILQPSPPRNDDFFGVDVPPQSTWMDALRGTTPRPLRAPTTVTVHAY